MNEMSLLEAVKAAWQSRTIKLGLAIVIGGIIEANFGLLRPYMSPETYALAFSTFGGLMMLMRSISTTPLFKK